MIKSKISNKSIGIIVLILIIAIILLAYFLCKPSRNDSTLLEDWNSYRIVDYPTPNVAPDTINEVLGVVLHHTAEPTAEKALRILTSTEKKVGAHVVIDTDGTRYIMTQPTFVTYHAGYSVLNGREGCNYFTIGIEFQGNTLEDPLTENQIESGIEYLLPIIKAYNIPLTNIVTHQMIRTAYKEKHPESRCSGKVDITQTEYKRFMNRLHIKLSELENYVVGE